MEKFDFEFVGLELLEPNAMITNIFMAIICLLIVRKMKSFDSNEKSLKYWVFFFKIFGFSSILGGLSHLFYNYTGEEGKLFAFSIGMVSNFFMENAVFEKVSDKINHKRLVLFSYVKLLGSIALLIVLFLLSEKASFILVMINTAISAVGVLGWFTYVVSKESIAWKSFFTAIMLLLASLPIQILKINPHILFNRNDITHLLVGFVMIYFYKGVKELYQSNTKLTDK